MKHVLLAFALVVALAVPSYAGYLGEYCWKLAGEEDTIKLAITQNGSQYEAHGSWSYPGLYEMAVAGNAFVTSGGYIQLNVMGANPYTYYPGWTVMGNIWLGSNLAGSIYIVTDNVYYETDSVSLVSCPAGPYKEGDVAGKVKR